MLSDPLNTLEGQPLEAMQQRLYSEHSIEVPLMRWNGRTMLRVSCQVYNRPQEYERLADVVEKIK